jgi:rod shape determining protein RodA
MAVATKGAQGLRVLQRERALRPDLLIVIPYVLLSAFGVLMVYTASAPRLEALDLGPSSEMTRQAAFVVAGAVVFLAASMIDTRQLKMVSPWIYLGSVVSLVVVLTDFGTTVRRASRWIDIGPIRLQPSEFAKVAVILMLAVLLSVEKTEGPLHWSDVARALGIVGVPAGLIFLQPDLGTMLVFGFIAIVMLFIGGTTMRQLATTAVVATFGAVGLFQVGAIKEYQVTRLTAFLDSSSDALQANYNQLQSEIAIGSGGFLGKGLQNGTQTNLRFVPEQSTDFIFTAIGEQLGFVGGIIVLALFVVIIWRLLVAAVAARDRFGQLVAGGVAAMLTFHVFVNVGMTVRLMPVTGLPLPLLSAGGSAFITMSLALGLAHSIWMRRSPVPGERQIL